MKQLREPDCFAVTRHRGVKKLVSQRYETSISELITEFAADSTRSLQYPRAENYGIQPGEKLSTK